MAGNKAVAYLGPGKVEVTDIGYPKLELQDGPGVNKANIGRKVEHGGVALCWTTLDNAAQHMTKPDNARHAFAPGECFRPAEGMTECMGHALR